MNIKGMIPSMNEAIKIVIVVVVLTATGIGAVLSSKAGKLLKR